MILKIFTLVSFRDVEKDSFDLAVNYPSYAS